MKTRLNYIGIIALIGIASFTACEKMPDVVLPTVVTNEATNITYNEAVMSATFTLDEHRPYLVKRAFELSNNESTLSGNTYYFDDEWTPLIGSSTVTVSFNSLSPNTIYYYRAVLFPQDAAYSAPVYGNVVTFRTEEKPAVPSVTIILDKVTSVTSTTARVYGKCEASNITIADVGILIRKGQAPTIDANSGNSSMKKFSKSFRTFWYSLKPSTLYYVRTYAKDADGNYYYSEAKTFTTKAEPGGPLTVDDFVGTFTLNAYSPWEKKNVTWTNMKMSSYNGGDTLDVRGWDNNSKFQAVGIFDKGLQVVRFESNWYYEELSFKYRDSTVYAIFTPIWYNAANDTAYNIESGGKKNYGEIWLKKTSTNQYEFISSDGDSDKGYYANGFIFLYESVKYFIKCGYSKAFTNARMTRTSTSTSNAPRRDWMLSPQLMQELKQDQDYETEEMAAAITD